MNKKNDFDNVPDISVSMIPPIEQDRAQVYANLNRANNYYVETGEAVASEAPVELDKVETPKVEQPEAKTDAVKTGNNK